MSLQPHFCCPSGWSSTRKPVASNPYSQDELSLINYSFVGGIKATFLTDYIHTFTILIIACFFTVKVFTVNDIGSVGHLYELVKAAGERHPVVGNHNGSYLTMTSKGGIEFAIIHLVTNFGLVIMDTSYFIKAFAASPRAVVPGYVIGGIAYFSIPWALVSPTSADVNVRCEKLTFKGHTDEQRCSRSGDFASLPYIPSCKCCSTPLGLPNIRVNLIIPPSA